MNRFFATLTVLGLALLAIAICIRETIAGSQGMTASLVIETTMTTAIIASGAMLVRRRYIRQKKFAKRERYAAAQPLRRLLSAVWS